MKGPGLKGRLVAEARPLMMDHPARKPRRLPPTGAAAGRARGGPAAARRVGAGEGGGRSRAGTRGSRPVARRADEAAQRGRAPVPGVPDPAAGVHGTRSGVRLGEPSSTWRCGRSRTSNIGCQIGAEATLGIQRAFPRRSARPTSRASSSTPTRRSWRGCRSGSARSSGCGATASRRRATRSVGHCRRAHPPRGGSTHAIQVPGGGPSSAALGHGGRLAASRGLCSTGTEIGRAATTSSP